MHNSNYPYTVVVKVNRTDMDEIQELHSEIWSWCYKNIGINNGTTWYYHWGDSTGPSLRHLTFCFANQEDAVRFELTYG